jgi:hypothetical protein
VDVDKFERTRRHLKSKIGELVQRSLAEQEPFCADQELPVLSKEKWIPPGPMPLEQVSLRLRSAADAESLDEAKRRVRRLLPLARDRSGVESYSEAVGLYDRPKIWFDSCSYRLLEVRPDSYEGADSTGVRLTFAPARYFDGQDTSEFIAYELADRSLNDKKPLAGGAYRNWLSDPFRLDRRCALPGINALTIRSTGSESFFFMHHRDGDKVAVSMNTDHVAPAGEFQPHNDVLPVWRTDLNIWHNVMREYAEEFLGHKDSAGQGGSTINYERDEPYRQLFAAERRGDVVTRFLGIGLDPVSWKPEIAVACIWKAPVFDRIFARMTGSNPEGTLIVGEHKARGYEGMSFNKSNVLDYANNPATLPGGRMCLILGWRWRDILGIPEAGKKS